MDLRIITVGNLTSFVAEAEFSQLPDIPITPLRALSQFQNPNSESDDPALIVAYDEGGKILAYFGCLPDSLRQNKIEKVCWSSCWWVHPTKGQAAGMPVFYKALQLWNAKMLFDALPERSEAVLDKMGYFSFRKISGVHYFLRTKFHKIIPGRIPFLAPLKNIFFALDTLLNMPVQIKLAFQKRKNKLATNVSITQISEIDKETESFLLPLAKNEVLQRSSQTFNWIIQQPWLSSNNSFTKKYFFSSHADHFENILLKIHQDKKMIGFLWLSLRDGTAKLPYCYISPGHEDIATSVLINQLIENPVDTFICFQQNLLPSLAKAKSPFLYQKELSKTFAWTTVLDSYFSPPFYVQDGDGDTCFT